MASSESRDLELQIEALKKDIAAIADTLAKMGNDRVSQARHDAESKIGGFAQRAHEQQKNFEHKVRDAESQVEEMVREKPLASLAAAAGVGFLAALLTRR